MNESIKARARQIDLVAWDVNEKDLLTGRFILRRAKSIQQAEAETREACAGPALDAPPQISA